MNSPKYATKNTYEVAIIGAGFAGIGAGIKLKNQNDNSFIIFERAAEVGGTWRDNTYPGCACDIPSFLYSYSFEPNPEWSETFSPQAEILEYLKHCISKYQLEQHIRYNTSITKIEFDESKGHWTIWDDKNNETVARIIISAAGPFNAPMIPNIKGKDSFEGEAFHSLHWNHNYDLTDKKVVVIGTGASAIQFIPKIAPQVKKLTVFQRTPPWLLPKQELPYTAKSQARFKNFPLYQKFWREAIYWFLENRGRPLYAADNKKRAKGKKECLAHLEESVSDPILRKKLTPDYEVGCKRVLISSEYYPALQRPNVELVAEGVQEICPKGILKKDGTLVEADVIIYGTGFLATTFKNVFTVIGRGGRNLFEEWNEKGGEAYLGTAVSGFPNLLLMVGPNSGLGHNSIVHMMESQLNYILDYLKHLRQADSEQTYFDLKQEVQVKFNEEIQQQLSKMVWSAGNCKSYYLKNADGKNTSIWPGSTISFRRKTRKIEFKNYEVVSPKINVEQSA